MASRPRLRLAFKEMNMFELTDEEWEEPMEDDTVYATAEMVDRIMADYDADDPTLESYQTMTRQPVTGTRDE